MSEPERKLSDGKKPKLSKRNRHKCVECGHIRADHLDSEGQPSSCYAKMDEAMGLPGSCDCDGFVDGNVR